MIAIPVSQDVSRLFQSIEVDGHREPSNHITLFYLGDNININVIIDIIPILYEATLDIKPFDLTCSKIKTFPKGKYGYPVIAEIKSDQLTELRSKIKKMLDRNKIDYSDKFPEYNPHLTLSYSKKKPKSIKFPQKYKWTANHLSLFGGDEVDSKIFVNFPFDLGVKKEAMDRLTGVCYDLTNNMDLDSISSVCYKLAHKINK